MDNVEECTNMFVNQFHVHVHRFDESVMITCSECEQKSETGVVSTRVFFGGRPLAPLLSKGIYQ